jgi:DNA-binding GntR family transcriptional regulator
VIERPRTGFAVVQFDETMLRNVFDIRAELDAYATTLAISRITVDEVEILRSLVADCEGLAQTDLSSRARLEEMQLGMEIHRAIARFSGNAVLSEMLSGLLDKCQVYVWQELTQLNDWKAARDDHHMIVEAIAAGTPTRPAANPGVISSNRGMAFWIFCSDSVISAISIYHGPKSPRRDQVWLSKSADRDWHRRRAR